VTIGIHGPKFIPAKNNCQALHNVFLDNCTPLR
jgi:hypothetical protein